MGNSMVRLVNVTKKFSGEKDAAVNNVSLEINSGEFMTILGPSGCGKTTTLRIIAGFENADSGTVLIDNKDVTSLPPYNRSVNTVFQNYALFPHMNIYDNVAFGLKIKKVPGNEINKKVSEMLKIVKMDNFAEKMPDQLSGGQKQRAAIARAIINNPKVLLLDEPLGALDLKLRKQMQLELKSLQKELGITFVFVTHDQEEAMTMSDRICVMNNGMVEQYGTPEDIYERPLTRFVADFIGDTNIFEGTVVQSCSDLSLVKLDCGQLVNLKNANTHVGQSICFAIRPERLRLKTSPAEGESHLKANLKERIYTGSLLKTVVSLPGGHDIMISEPAGESYSYPSGETCAYVTWNPENSVVIRS